LAFTQVVDSIADRLRRSNYKALIAISGADGLIIQMDTDIAEKITDVQPRFSPTEDCRRGFCEKAVLHWLGETEHSLEGAYLLLPSYAIENWLLATWPPSNEVFADLDNDFEYEAIADVEQRLIALGVASKTIRQQQRLAKTPGKYAFYANKVHSQLEEVKHRCPEAQTFCSYLTSHCD
jgi:hypothetical protein